MLFNPSGKVPYMEYAEKESQKGYPVVCLKCTDGIFAMSLRPNIRGVSKLHNYKPQKVFIPNKNICIFCIGYLSDVSFVKENSESICTSYRDVFNEDIPINAFVYNFANMINKMSRDVKQRPIFLQMIICGWDDCNSIELYDVQPNGFYTKHSGIGYVCKGKDERRISKLLEEYKSKYSEVQTIKDTYNNFMNEYMMKYITERYTIGSHVNNTSNNSNNGNNSDSTSTGYEDVKVTAEDSSVGIEVY
jgi:20S proteasome alpha/beta subunit